ncbi:hypothetical protein [Bacteroides caecimuris]|uniref:hypothetical protein n=1 Tax=Bacteroides caecimuris TaxID=1796613 RepID=UPI001C3D181D|nr:hypothetical protein [Bacteroides caecimuris]
MAKQFHQISDEVQVAYDSTSIQTYTNSYTSKTNIIQLDKEQKLVKTKGYAQTKVLKHQTIICIHLLLI